MARVRQTQQQKEGKQLEPKNPAMMEAMKRAQKQTKNRR